MWKNVLLVLLLGGSLVLSGCYTTPVRHLAADIGLVKEGVSSEEDVLVFLGDPDKQKDLEDGSVLWVYEEEHKTVAESIPWLGSKLGSPGKTVVVILFQDGVVENVDYQATDPDELDWEKDYSWEKQ